ncbi:MAG: NUDIX hydrolase [Oscillospiraceae bacterium]|nr:NUDIX hydrolase [Oscillospiraceae bacterium]
MSHTEKTLDSTRIFEGVVVHLRRDTVELEDGSRTIREVIDHPGGVSILAMDADENILFVRQFRYPFGRTLLELPAGKLEPGESPADSGRRELKEETGCTAGRFEPMGRLIPTCAYDTEVIHLFFASDLTEGTQSLDENEFLSVERHPLDEALQMILDGEIIDAKTQIGLLKYKALRDAGRL